MTKKERDALREEEGGVKCVKVAQSYDPATVNCRISLEDRQDMWWEPLTSEYRCCFFSYFKDSPRIVK